MLICHFRIRIIHNFFRGALFSQIAVEVDWNHRLDFLAFIDLNQVDNRHPFRRPAHFRNFISFQTEDTAEVREEENRIVR